VWAVGAVRGLWGLSGGCQGAVWAVGAVRGLWGLSGGCQGAVRGLSGCGAVGIKIDRSQRSEIGLSLTYLTLSS
jgi:hypothetical protein